MWVFPRVLHVSAGYEVLREGRGAIVSLPGCRGPAPNFILPAHVRAAGIPVALKDSILACGAVKFGDFTLASGAKSSYYVDIKKASGRPDVLREIGEAIRPHTANHAAIAGMELGAVPIAVAASLASGLPYLIVRKQAKAHGTGSRIEGDVPKGARVLVVEDVTTTGGSSSEAIKVLRDAGYAVDSCVTVVDREQGATDRFAAEGVRLVPLVRVSDLLKQAGRA